MWENRKRLDNGNDCLVSVDGVDFQIAEPYPYEKVWSRRWFSNKFKGPGLRYELALCIMTGDIVWANGPYPPGLYSDYKIFMECGLKDMLDDKERVEADDGYTGADPKFAKTRSASWHPQAGADARNAVMARQETANNRLKKFGALNQIFRHKIDKHQDVFMAVVVLVQLSIDYGERLFDIDGYDDTLWV